MDQAISDRIVELAVKWQCQVSWTSPFKAADNWRKYRDKANQDSATANRMRQDGQHGEMLDLFQHGTERFDELAEFYHKQVIDAHRELTELENLLRAHAPKLLRLVPVVNFFDPQPDDVSPWLSAMREIEGEILALVEPTATPSNTVETPSEGIAGILDRLAVLFGDSGGKMMHVISNTELSTDQKLREMERIDKPRMDGMNSPQLGKLLDVTGQAIRDGDWWKERQVRSRD